MVYASFAEPALEMIRVSFAGAGIAFLGGLAWISVFWIAIPLIARR